MAEHPNAEELNGYARRTLAPGALLAADGHLEACAACRERIRDAADLESALLTLRQVLEGYPDAMTAHLTYEQLEAYVEGTEDRAEQDRIDAHLDRCDPCAAEARDLGAFVCSTRAGGEIVVPKPSAGYRIPVPALLLALAAALVVTLATAWLVPASLRRQIETLRAELERVRSETPAAPTLPAAGAGPGTPAAAFTMKDRRGPVGLDANGDLIGLDALTVSEGRLIAAALRRRRAETPADLRDLIGSNGILLGEPEKGSSLAPIAPVGTVVCGGRPTFSWRPLPDAESYVVAVYDADFNPITRSERLARTSWTPPQPLNREVLYVWQVIARRGEEEITSPAPPAPEARFKVLGARESAALERAVRETGGSHLAAGVLLAHAGCVDDARKEFQALLDQNPDSQVARDLKESVAGIRPPSR